MKNKAFTLIELILLITILTILIGISVPRFSRTYNSLATETNAKKILNLIKFAQIQAINNKTQYHIQIIDNYLEISELKHFPYSKITLNPNLNLTINTKTITIYSDGSLSDINIELKSGNVEYTILSKKNSNQIYLIKNYEN